MTAEITKIAKVFQLNFNQLEESVLLTICKIDVISLKNSVIISSFKDVK